MIIGGCVVEYSKLHFDVLVMVLASVIALSICPSSAVARFEKSKLVLVIYPDETDGAPGNILVNRAIRSTFATESHQRVEILNEYVNTSRVHDIQFMEAQITLLRQKYSGRKVDLVIAGLSSGLDFALKHRDELFPGVPIVFVTVDQREVESRRLPPDVIGIPIRMELKETLDIALRLHPDTHRVYVVAGSAPFDRAWAAEARKTFHPYEDRLEFISLTGLPMDVLLERLGNLPKQSLVYYLHIHQDGDGNPFFPADALDRLSARTNAPIYGHVDTYIGRGAVGGRVFVFENEGKHAARLALRILAGERPESIAVSNLSENFDMFDWQQLQRWGVSEANLPSGSVVRNKQLTFWGVYRWQIVGVITLCVIQALLIAGLIVQLVKRRREEARFQQVVETAPAGMLMFSQDGIIVMVNAQIERLFGYAKYELLGQPVELLWPERLFAQHLGVKNRGFPPPDTPPMGLGRELSMRRKDGSEFPVEVGLSSLQTRRGVFVLASIIDLTERRRAEEGLRESQKELQLLTGRLLEAQELERRRIARDLHDDVNQSLALLTVEMDILAGSPPRTAVETAHRVRELSARVKELSSSVHDLSYQLHPSKLEQLGLVVALRSLCKEMGHTHNLMVKFTHYPEPVTIPQDIALCLYRIVQEALRNVVKHSGSRFATVELKRTVSTICLRVVDDGIGFDSNASSIKGGLGLISMRERLHAVGGEINIESRPSDGTRINVSVPTSGTDSL